MVVIQVMKTTNGSTKLHFKNLYAISGLKQFTDVFIPFINEMCTWSGADLTEMSTENNLDTGFPSVDQIRWEFSDEMAEHVIEIATRFLGRIGGTVYVSR